MAIQFNCPYCTAAIRVADAAAGKVGTCPKCATKLRVPEPPAPPAAPAVETRVDETEPTPAPVPESPAPFIAPEPPVDDAALPGFSINTEPTPVAADPSRSPFDFAEPAKTDQATSYADQLRRRRGRNWGALIVPLICAAILVGVGVAYWWSHRETMTGEFAGELLEPGHTLVTVVPSSLIDVPAADLQTALDAMREAPVTITSELMYVEFRGDARGIGVLLEAGPEASLVRADLRPNPLLAKFYADHAGELDAVRREELKTGVTRFVEDWQSTTSSGMLLGNTLAYRDSLGLNALLKGLGFHVGAIVGDTLYPCVHEDDEGRLYFIVPRGTTRFEIKELPSDGPARLPEEFHFTISVPQPEPRPEAESTEDEAAPASDAENADPAPGEMAPEPETDGGDDEPAAMPAAETPSASDSPP